MRKLTFAAASALVLASVPMAFAATASGAIKSIDSAGHALTLNDGKVYQLPSSFQTASLKVGEKVNVTYEMQNGKMVASAVTQIR